MLFSQHTKVLAQKFGVEKAVNMLADAGFPAVDITMGEMPDPPFFDDWRGLAKRLNAIAKEKGIVYNQAHAPVGHWEQYINNVIPMLPDVFEFAGMVGIPNVVVHPIMRGYYYDDKDAMIDENLEFYSKIAPLAKNAGTKIAIENMWQRHRVSGKIGDCVGASPAELVYIYDTLADPQAFTVCLDTGHVALCGREPEDAIKSIGHDKLGALHVHDVDYVEDLHTLPGVGSIRWDKVCRALGEINYKGDLTLEAYGFYKNFEDSQLPIALKFMADITSTLCKKIDSYRVV